MKKTSLDFLPLWDYFRDCFVPFQNLELPMKPLHKGTCEALEKAFLGELHKSFIIINIPPRVGKTKMMEAFLTWILAYFPDAQNLYTCYSNELARTSVKYIQEVILSNWYQELFDTKLGQIRQADHFTTTDGGKVYGDGVGGSLTGLGAGLKRKAGGVIVIDDPAKPDEALSRVESEKLRFWFENTLKSRRNSSQWTPIIICMQRLDSDDLTGFLLQEYPDDIEHIVFPAMVDGESVIPETVSTQSLRDTERVNPFAFAAQYQQSPVVLGGNLIRLADFKYYEYGNPPKIEHKLITCDTALKAKTSNDYSVLQCWGRSLKRAFLIDQVRGRWEPAELIQTARRFYEKHHKQASPVAYMAVEEAAAGSMMILELRKRGIPARGIVRRTDKVSRIMDILPYQATGMVYLPRGASWLPGFESEIAQFRKDGKSARDDQCLVAGTLIQTRRGEVPIEQVSVRDEVMTRWGWLWVIKAGQTGYSDDLWTLRTSDGHTLEGTGSHPIWTEEHGFLRLDSVTDGDTVKVWLNQSQSFSTASVSAVTQRVKSRPTPGIIGPQATTSEQASSTSTKRFGKPRMVSSPLGTSSITSMETRTIMTSGTWPRSRTKSISQNTGVEGIGCPTAPSSSPTLPASETSRSLGTGLRKAWSGTRRTVKKCFVICLRKTSSAWSVVGRSNRGSTPNTAQVFAKAAPDVRNQGNTPLCVAASARTNSLSSPVTSVERTGQLRDSALGSARGSAVAVFNLTVQGFPEYVANGVLTHNCDPFADGISLLLGKGTSILSVIGVERVRAHDKIREAMNRRDRTKD